jgi:hypothetical protein
MPCFWQKGSPFPEKLVLYSQRSDLILKNDEKTAVFRSCGNFFGKNKRIFSKYVKF